MKKNHPIHSRLAALAFAAAVSLMLASCGSSDSSSKGGTVSLQETSAAEAVSSSSEASDVSEPAAESTPGADDQSAASEGSTPAVPATASFAEKTKYIYNGATFEIGSKFADVKDKLGDQAKPSATSTPCVPGAHDVEYFYYAGLIIQVNFEGTIMDIQLNEEMAPGRDGTISVGLKLGDTREKAKELLGEPASEDEYSITYKDPDSKKTLSIYDRENEGIYIIGLTDSEIPF